jgi:hypothetical protein
MTRPRFAGFVSQRNAHRHVLKHVLRLAGLDAPRLGDTVDPERWHELIPAPPLTIDLRSRRRTAVDRLRASACPAGPLVPTRTEPCSECTDAAGIGRVDAEFRELLAAYEGIASRVIEWGCSNPARGGPRLLAYRTESGPQIEGWDDRGVFVVGRFDTGTGAVQAITCFREETSRSVNERWLELCRRKASHKRSGRLIDILPTEDERVAS